MATRRAAPVLTVREFEQVPLPPALDSAATRERLEETALRTGVRAFEIRGRRLFARGVIGVVDAGSVVVEILPKVRSDSTTGEDSAFLGDLLRFVGGTGMPAVSKASIAAAGGSLLEVLLAWAARLIARNMRDGLPRRYAEHVEASTSVRGRVDLRRLAGQHPGRTLELTVRHAPLGQENAVSRAIKWLVRDVSQRTRSIGTRALCLRILDEMASIADQEPDLDTLDEATLRPFEGHWAPVLALARAFLAQRRLDPARGGSVPGAAVLLTLHDLFEGAVRRVLRDGLPTVGHVLLGGRAGHLLVGSGRPPLIRLRPDFRLGVEGRQDTEVVGDAKWKRVLNGAGPPRLDENDAYQVIAYAAALGARRAFVVAPLSSDLLRRELYRIAGLDVPLEILGVHVPTLVNRGPAGQALRHALCAAVAGPDSRAQFATGALAVA